MARKSAVKQTKQAQIDEAVDNWKSLTEIRFELAMEAFNAQDAATQRTIERIRDRLRLGAQGWITVKLSPPHGGTIPVKVEQQYLDFNLLYVAVEILKDLAIVGVKIGTYKLPPMQCVSCGAEITKEREPKRRRR